MLTVYKSSAGSGKTYTLVKEFLKLILTEPTAYKNILAVTFTNKATAEMKQRLIEKLVDVCENKDAGFIDAVSHEIQLPPAQIVLNAKYALQLILHNYTNLSVQTIDSFFNKTVRSLSKELNLPLQFDVELNQELVKQMIVDALLASIGDDRLLAAQLEAFALQKMDDDKGWNIEYEIYQVSDQLFKEKFRELISDGDVKLYDKDLFEAFRKEKAVFENTMTGYGRQYLDAFEKNGFDIDDFVQKGRGVIGWFKKLADGIIEAPSGAVEKKLGDIDPWSKKNENVNSHADVHLLSVLSHAVNFYEKNFTRYYTCTAISKLSNVSQLVERLEEQLRIYRKENEIILISDISSIIKTFISKSNSPFIFEKTGNRYKSFLIDEFQDTSNFQWNNFLPLIENALSEGSESLVVGDVKQSIYRWRGGNMKLLYKKLFTDLRLYSSLIEVKILNTNYRSKRTIVDFNNLLFAAAPHVLRPFLNSELQELADSVYSYDEVTQHITPKHDSDGFVHVEFIDEKSSSNEDGEKWKAISKNKMLAAIQSLFERNYGAGDITILVRSNAEGADVAEFLLANGIDKIMTSESLSLASAPQINLLIHAMKLVVDRKDFVSQCVIENELQFLNAKGNVDFLDRNASEKIKYVFQNFKQLNQLTIYELAERLIGHFNLNKNPDAYIQRLLDLMLELNAMHIYTVEDFIGWWDENKYKETCSVITPDNADAIRIMTIHKSKGLQFKIVMMPFAEWSLTPKPNDIIWAGTDENPFNALNAYPLNPTKMLLDSHFSDAYKNEISEAIIDNLNILYVAFTRAEEQLYVFSKANKTIEEINSASKMLLNLMLANADMSNGLNNEKIFTAGNADLKPTLQKKQHEIAAILQFISNDWKEKISVRTTRDENLLSEKISEKIDRGILIHFALSKIETANDADVALQLTCNKWQLNSDERNNLESIIHEILKHKNIANWWNGTFDVKTEAAVMQPDGTEHRFDRVMFSNGDAIIVDYKTGAKEAAHKNQINSYASVLNEMGFKVAEKYLLYLEPFELVKC